MNLFPSSSLASVPENNLKFPLKTVGLKSLSFNKNMEAFPYSHVIERFERVWKPVLSNEYNKKLIVTIDWEDERVNASCTRDDDNNPWLKIRGGLLRHPRMNDEVLNFLLCHELGHFMGGAPKYFRGRSTKRSWSSVEGQADYFAASKCLPKMYSEEIMLNDREKSNLIKERVKSVCQGEVCSKVVYSGVLAAEFFASLKSGSRVPVIGEFDTHYPSVTLQKHPGAQCRLDTIISAVNCDIDYSIPLDNSDIAIGACLKNEVINSGERAACWFNESSY